jgi:hypothetical protein
MGTLLKVLSLVVRVAAVVVLVLGVSFWFDWINSDTHQALLGIHEAAGMLIGLGLLFVGSLCIVRGSNVALGIVAIVIAAALPIIGLSQTTWLAGDQDPHWLIQALHLALGLGALFVVEIGKRGLQTAKANGM